MIKKNTVEGSIPVIAGGKKPACFHNASNRPGNIITISASGANAGYVNYFPYPIFASDCITVGSKDEGVLMTKFAYLYLRSIQEMVYDFQKGAGQPHVYSLDIASIEIPVPSIDEQRETVSKLDKISELIAMKKAAILKTEALTQSVFSKMFLEAPAKKQKMSEAVERIQIGPFGTQLHFSDYTDGGIPLINPINLKNGKIVPDFSNTIRLEKASSLPEYLLKEGDLIMGRRGEMGRCALVTPHENGWFCGTGSLYIRTSGTINGLYLSYLLRTDEYVKILENESRGATMANLNKRIISELPIPIPSQEALKTLDMIHENNLRIFYNQKKSLSILESLYDATAQNFFSHKAVTTNG